MTAFNDVPAGKLILVSTPIGNLGDMTPRACDALTSADVICAEDTRVTGKLIAALGLEAGQLERLDENIMERRIDEILERIRGGETIAYATDAGMPGISDPGLRLVAAARKAGVAVETLPGPSAAVTAYVTSGISCPQFYFGGFFPRKAIARRQLLEALAPLDAALIFYESPNRLASALKAVAAVFPLRQVAVCRELTKLHEEVLTGLAPVVANEIASRDAVKGEIVLVIDRAPKEETSKAQADGATLAIGRAQELLAAGGRPKTVAASLVEEFGLARNEAYDLVLATKDSRA